MGNVTKGGVLGNWSQPSKTGPSGAVTWTALLPMLQAESGRCHGSGDGGPKRERVADFDPEKERIVP